MIVLKGSIDFLDQIKDNIRIKSAHGEIKVDNFEHFGESSVEDTTPPTHVVEAHGVQFIGAKDQVVKKKIGYYVDKKYFGAKHSQAIGFAKNRAKEFGRSVYIKYVDHDGEKSIVDTIEGD